MSHHYGIVLIDHHNAQILQFTSDESEAYKIKAHTHNTHQHKSSVRTEHEFFGEVCDVVNEIDKLLITGSQMAQADFRHYIEKHRSDLSKQIVGWETVNQPTENELLAFGRDYFTKNGGITNASIQRKN